MPVLVVKVVVLGAFVAFVLWCMYEAVVEYRFEREIQQEMDSLTRKLYNWTWRRRRRVRPLFHEQGEDDV